MWVLRKKLGWKCSEGLKGHSILPFGKRERWMGRGENGKRCWEGTPGPRSQLWSTQEGASPGLSWWHPAVMPVGMALPGASSRFAAAVFGYLSQLLCKGWFSCHVHRPRKAAPVALGGRQAPPACSAPRQPGDSPAPALLLPAQGGSWWPRSAKVGLDHPSLLLSWLWACMGNERGPDATWRLFFFFFPSSL